MTTSRLMGVAWRVVSWSSSSPMSISWGCVVWMAMGTLGTARQVSVTNTSHTHHTHAHVTQIGLPNPYRMPTAGEGVGEEKREGRGGHKKTHNNTHHVPGSGCKAPATAPNTERAPCPAAVGVVVVLVLRLLPVLGDGADMRASRRKYTWPS